MKKMIEPAPPHKDSPACQEGLCKGASRPLPAGRGRMRVGPSLRLGSPRPQAQGQAGQDALGAEKALSHVLGTRHPERGAFRERGCGDASAPGAAGCRGAQAARVCGAAGARPDRRGRAGRPVTREQQPGRRRPRLPGVSGPECGGCQRLASPLPAGPDRPFRGPFGKWGEGNPAERPRTSAPATLLVPLFPQVPFSVSSRVLSSFICFPRSSPFQGPICSRLFCFHPSPAFRPLSSFPCTPRTFAVGGEGRSGKV